MSLPQQTIPRILDIPVMGLNKRDPLATMSSAYSPWLLNWDPEPQYCRVRGGWKLHAIVDDIDAFAAGPIQAICTHGDSKLFAIGISKTTSGTRVYDVTTSTITTAYSTLYTGSAVRSVKYAGRSGFCSPTGEINIVYDGTTWGTMGWTYGGSPISPWPAAFGFKGRVYMPRLGDGYVYWSDTVGGVTGSTSRTNISYFFDEDWGPEFGGTFASGAGVEDLIFFGNRFGEVLIYGGDNPGAANWQQVAKFNFPSVLYYHPFVRIDGDVLLLTTRGVISLRAALSGNKSFEEVTVSSLSGNKSFEEVTVSSAIDPYWQALVAKMTEGELFSKSAFITGANAIYARNQNKIFISMMGAIDNNGDTVDGYSTVFVCDLFKYSWTIHQIPVSAPVETLVYLQGELAYLQGEVYMAYLNLILKYDPNYYQDYHWEDEKHLPYDIELQSAYQSFGNLTKYKTTKNLELIVESDFGQGHMGAQVASDMGRSVSGVSAGSAQTGNHTEHYTLGVQGTYLQYRLTGKSDPDSTIGYKLYSAGMGIVP